MATKPIKFLALHYTMTQFLIIIIIIIIILYLTTCHLGAESWFTRERETNYKIFDNKLIRTYDKR